MSNLSVERLARALYLTAPGSNGYPPSHLSIPWSQWKLGGCPELERARRVLAVLSDTEQER